MAAGTKPAQAPAKTFVTFYLVLYNLLSFVLWLRVFLGALLFLVQGSPSRRVVSGWFVDVMSRYAPSMLAAPARDYSLHHPILAELLKRASTLHDYVAPLLLFTQSLAVLEVVHVAIGIVKSNLVLTTVQVISRLLIVWLVSEKYAASAYSPFYASLVLAWSLSEVARYPFYVNQLLNTPSFMALWARYSFFIVLYPIGVMSEVMLIWNSLPHDAPWPWQDASAWSLRDLVFLGTLVLYPPGLFMLYTKLLASRRKVLGTDFIGSKGREEMRKLQSAKYERLRTLHEKSK